MQTPTHRQCQKGTRPSVAVETVSLKIVPRQFLGVAGLEIRGACRNRAEEREEEREILKVGKIEFCFLNALLTAKH